MKTKLLLSIFAPYAMLALGALFFSSSPVHLWQAAGAACLPCLYLTAWAMFESCPNGRTGKYTFNVVLILIPHMILYTLVGFLGLVKFEFSNGNFAALFSSLKMEVIIPALYAGLMSGGMAWLIAIDLLRANARTVDSKHFNVNWRQS